MLIRREVPGDQRAIAAVHDAAFPCAEGTPAAETVLVDALRTAGDTIAALSLVAERDGQIVGHVLASRAHLDTLPCVGLAPLGVLPSHQRRGVGSALMHAVLAAADALDVPAAVLLGDPAYYRRFGFQPAGPRGVLPQDPGWAEHLQIRTLNRWDGRARGVFRYAPAFAAL
ncbi:GNAT family N-acetyltransferase [Frankia sp. AgKG'84/4]|uniref:GNAT family N-acetyltransferase n=1 Tax=Frankia sp. AgKG'84/4 TaxID=573490 RepID=UPI00200F60D5|nr:N-acetyltransferase [Frankia sp. AgKG'84/4]MCL9794705.1 N-acetyltransferase [Frankia sp. AgKG'84/4]